MKEKKVFLFKSKLNSFLVFALLSSSVSRANLSCVVATIFSSLAFLSTSVSMANLSCLLETTFSRYRDAVHRYRDAVHTRTRYTDTGTRYTDYRDVSLQLIFITSLQSFESGLALILVRPFLLLTTLSSSYFFAVLFALSFSRLILSLSLLCSSVTEA